MQVETRGAPEDIRPPFKLEYDPALPITAHRVDVIEAIQRHPVIVLCGATGSGKSTQLPKLCLEAGRGVAGVIGHTQPRRIAARALASRLAEETATTVGGAIGYKVRFNDRTGPQCRVKLMTDGILLKELESDRKLRRYDTLIIDEAHERSLNIDLLLGVLKQLIPQRPDLRLIVTSATIDPGKFATFFGGAPVIEVSGRSYPVEVRYRPLITSRESEAAAFGEEEEDLEATAGSSADGGSVRGGRPSRRHARPTSAFDDEDAVEITLPEGIIEAVRELDAPDRGGAFGQGSRGDVLVFLPGEKHIREAADALEKARLPSTEILPLFARLSTSDQERIFQRHGQRRIVLATNVAETSLTVPGIRHVIDSGLARISRYSVRGKVQRLPIERVSKASADQRKGRCGRERDGICVRLYSEEDFGLREDFTPPEVLRTHLASVILRMATLGLGDPESFPFLDPPDTRLVNDGVRLLQELKAMDDDRRVSSLGQQIAAIPVDPRLGRMLLAASRHHCLTEMLVLTSFLEGQDPRERPTDAQQQAREKHAQFADARSDFITVLNIWRAYNEQSAALSKNQLRKWCKENFLSFLRMREWQDLHKQLTQSLDELRLRPNQMPANFTDLHQAILTGFLGSIGELDEKREYNGPRGMRFVIAPGTPLASKPPRWVVAGSIVETTRLYARMVASVDPGWIEAAGAHLVKRSHTEPHWVAERGYVSAYESVALYGLTLASRRRVNYGAIAPREARDIFIREALVEKAAVEDASTAEEYADYDYLSGAGAERRGTQVATRMDHGKPNPQRRGKRPRVVVEGDFFAANRQLRAEVESYEAKIRRRDVVVDEERQLAFYASRIPERVNSIQAFNHWRAEAEKTRSRLLYMSRADLMQRDVPEAGDEQFPNEWPVGGNPLPLLYKFDPAEPADGVTLVVPEPLLDVVNAEQLAWLVPGLRLEKVIAVFRALPKAQRKLLVPVPDFAKRALEDLAIETARLGRLPGFHEWLATWVTQQVGSPMGARELAALELPTHLRMNLRVIDAGDRVIAEGRDLLAIRRGLYSAGAPQGAEVRGGPRAGSDVVGSAGQRGVTGAGSPVRGDVANRAGGATAGRAGGVGGGHAGGPRGGGAANPAGRGGAVDAAGAASEPSVDFRAALARHGGGSLADALKQAVASRGDAEPASVPPDVDTRGGGVANDRDRVRSASASRNAPPTPSQPGSHAPGASRPAAATAARPALHAPAVRPAASPAAQPAPQRPAVRPAASPAARSGPQAPPTARPLTSTTAPRPGPSPGALASTPAPTLHRQWDFGEVPESREVERNRLRLVVYPAIEDRAMGVALIEARNLHAAQAISRAGIVRLAILALPQQAKYVSKRVSDDRDLVLLSRGLELRQSLADALTQRAFRECFFPDDAALPRNAQSFDKVLEDRRAQLSDLADRLANIVTAALREWRAARTALDGLRGGSFADVVADINTQLVMLLPPDFIESTPRPWLDYLSRYLKAITRRMERLPPNVRRDAELFAKVKPFTTALRALMAEPAITGIHPETEQLRWMIEEYRVSLFAQDLKTMLRVSDKRLAHQLAVAREAQH